MAKVKDGGAAFPTPSVWADAHAEQLEVGDAGMTLRDYFAGQALAAVVALAPPGMAEEVAATAYLYADAMIKARG